MTQKLDKHKLDNGLMLLGERMEAVESVAFGFMLPAGASVMPAGCCGAANVIADWIFRGAGQRDNRQLGDALDGLGLQRSSGVDSANITITAALEASNLSAAIDLYGDIILHAKLDDEQFIPTRQLAIEGVKGLDDDPRHKVMLKLREQFYPEPLGRSAAGEIADLESLTPQTTKKIIAERFNPAGMIFSVAGKYDFDAIVSQLEKIFGVRARFTQFGELGGAFGRCCEPRIAAASAPAGGRQETLAFIGQVGDDHFIVRAFNDGPERHLDEHVFAVLAMAIGAGPVYAGRAFPMGVIF